MNITQGHSQPRPPNPETFPWTFGHPETNWNVSTEAGASFRKEAHQGKASGKDVLQYGMCHRDFKGTVVLMASSMPSILLPLHRTYADFAKAKFPLANTMEHHTSSPVHSLQYDSGSSGSEFAVPEMHDTFASNDDDGSDEGHDTTDSEDSNNSVNRIRAEKSTYVFVSFNAVVELHT
jgi:hypothetical protein